MSLSGRRGAPRALPRQSHLLCLAAALICYASAAAPARPNIIFMILDDQDSLLGATDVMPHYVQRFAVEGMQMSNAFVASPKCCPSRTSLLSGRFAHNLKDTADGWCGDFLSAKRYDAMFMADVKAQGYAMGLVGKIVNSMGPMCSDAAHVPTGFDVANGDLFVAMCNEVVYYKNTFNRNGQLYTTGTSPADYLQAFIGNETIPWLQRVAKAAGSGGAPFFAYLAPHAPHFPAEPAPWYSNAPLPNEIAPRVPSFNNFTAGKNWAIQENAEFDPFTIAGIDLHFRNRQRSLMSVDDYVRDIFAVLEATGTLDNTYVIATSDHGYHLGNFRIPFEKSTMYDTDVRVPFYVRGPGVPAGVKAQGLVSLMDVGATILELTGATAPGARTTDGRSFVPLLRAGGPPPPSWRPNGLLIEHISESNQWMGICGWVFNATDCPAPRKDHSYIIDGPQNTWALLRIVNASSDISYSEYRPQGSDIVKASTNWTELYDNGADPWQGVNLAGAAPSAPASTLDALSETLWRYADCALDTCP